MAKERRFLIGRGERLTETVTVAKNIGDKHHPYTFASAKQYIAPQARAVAKSLNALPASACPGDQAIAMFALHPSYLAKGYYPAALLKAVGLRSVGSRMTTIRTRKGTVRQRDKDLATAELYVAGSRRVFKNWAERIASWTTETDGAIEIRQLEDIYTETPEERIRQPKRALEASFFEAVLHMTEKDAVILAAFEEYLDALNGKARMRKRQQVGGLCFVPIEMDGANLPELAKFAFLRGVREMPEMRSFTPFRSSETVFTPELPDAAATNPYLSVAILDGGLPETPDISRWAISREAAGVGAAIAAGLRHGLGVTSAALFGPLEDGEPLATPYAQVEHYRIADNTLQEPNYYELIPRVESVLKSKHFDYVNISMGSIVPVDDSLVDLWTAKLDELMAGGITLAFIAAGNSGRTKEEAKRRIGPPSDAVNAITVGACDTIDHQWDKARYSSVGPGRGCGIVKPDVVAFGGDKHSEKFGLLEPGTPTRAGLDIGTSYASPLAMRVALGTAAHFGYALRPLAVKALLVHHAVRQRHHIAGEVGWGRIPHDYTDIVSCTADTAQIVYQGTLNPGKYLRALVPVPQAFGFGPVYITATICFTTEVEPQNTVSYTRAGLEVFFRPHAQQRKSPTQRHPDTAPFFKASDLKYADGSQRVDAMKWETTLKKQRRFDDPSALVDPAFDIHYVAREDGANATKAKPIPYAMVVTVRQKGNMAIYDGIVQRFRGRLEPLAPRLGVPVRVLA